MDPKEKRLRLMRFWLFGSVVIVFAAVTAYLYMFTLNIVSSLTLGLPIWGIVAVVAVLIFFGYRAWLRRQP
ncbi:MAG TPA: hypothetical protein VLL77_04450 [Anaerolineales bacterium]|nr:hypothetical protein [Anaerolineales bacterium]